MSSDTHPTALSTQSDKEKIHEAILKVLTKIDSASSRLEKVEKQVNLGNASSDVSVPPAVKEFDELVSVTISPLLEVSGQIEHLVEELLDMAHTAIQGTRQVLVAAHDCKKPVDFEEFVRPLVELVAEISNFSEKHKSNSKVSDHLIVLSKGMSALAFISSSAPITYLQQRVTSLDPIAAKFLKDNKSKQLDCALAENVLNFVKGLELIIQKHYSSPVGSTTTTTTGGTTTGTGGGSGVGGGIAWNSSGRDPPSRIQFNLRGIQNQGTTIARGIPKLETDSAKIYCEHISGDKKDIECDKKQSVYMLYCNNSNITLKGKASSITIDGCGYSKIVVPEVGSVVIVNGHRLEVTCTGGVGSITIERTYGCTINFTNNPNTTASPSSNTNTKDATPSTSSTDITNSDIKISGSAHIFVGVPNEELSEIPTQIKTKVRHGKLTSTLIDNSKQ